MCAYVKTAYVPDSYRDNVVLKNTGNENKNDLSLFEIKLDYLTIGIHQIITKP